MPIQIDNKQIQPVNYVHENQSFSHQHILNTIRLKEFVRRHTH